MVRQYLTEGYRFALPALAGVAVALALTATPAHAEIDYPICLRFYGGHNMPSYDDCAYTTMEQCKMTASGLPAQCLVNPFYGVRGTPVTQPRKPRHRRAQ